jgi:hypothetical protein
MGMHGGDAPELI